MGTVLVSLWRSPIDYNPPSSISVLDTGLMESESAPLVICHLGNMSSLGWVPISALPCCWTTLGSSINCRKLSWVLQCSASLGWLWLHLLQKDSSYMCKITPTVLKSTYGCTTSSAAQLQLHWCELCPWATDVTYIPYKMSIRLRFTPKDMGWYLNGINV